MKFRLSFVTNSSSSSFTCVAMYSKELFDFLQNLIENNKYCNQPEWNKGPRTKTELYLKYRWNELKFDQRWYKVQVTEEYGSKDKEGLFKYICMFFEGLTPEEESTLKELIFDVYKNDDFQIKEYIDHTDGFTGFDFTGNYNKIADNEENEKKINDLMDKLNEMAVKPESTDLYMKAISIDMYKINGYGVYDPDSERYEHLDHSFLKNVRPRWITNDDSEAYRKRALDEEKREVWGEHLRKIYDDAVDDVGAIVLHSISSRSDYVIVNDSFESVANKNALMHSLGENIYSFDNLCKKLSDKQIESLRQECFIKYLNKTVDDIEEANAKKSKNAKAIKVIWESQFHDFLMKHTSLGNVTTEPVVGPQGSIRRKVPDEHKRTVEHAVKEMIHRWPSRVINTRTRTYNQLVKDISECCKDLGYSDTNEFFDAYGFTIKKDEVNTNAKEVGDYQVETILYKGVTIVKYIGNETEVRIPETINGHEVTTIGKEAFYNNIRVESIILPESIKEIKRGAFGYCRNLKKIHLSNSIEKMVAGIFDGCDKLEEINIPDEVQSLPSKLLRDCPIKSLHIGKSLASINKDAFYEGEMDQTSFCYNKTSAVESIIIDPENKHLKSVGSMILSYDGKVLYAMLGNENSCIVPKGVEIIVDKAFYRMGLLEKVTFPDSLRLVGNSAFESTGIAEAIFPESVRIIGTKAFTLCRNLESVSFSEGLEEIYSGAFSITKIKSVIFPQTLKKLGKQSFDIWTLEIIEPDKWKDEIGRWNSSPDEERVDTEDYIQKLKNESLYKAAEAQLENKIGFGLLTLMMLHLKSDAADNLNLTDRLKLEQEIISKKMESALGTNLKIVLSAYKQESTDRLGNCVRWLLEEADKDTVHRYILRIKEVYPGDEKMDSLLKSISDFIKVEA